MKRLLVLIVPFVIASQIPLVAFAEESGPITVANLFSWLTTNPPDWGRGILFALLGLVGALVTIFGLIGGVVPGTAGQAGIDADDERLKIMSDQLVERVKTPSTDPKSIEAIERTVNNLRDDLRSEKWRQFSTAALLYAVLGAFFATLIARDILQALVIGAGWTTAIGTLGLKKDFAERKSTKDASLKETLDALEKAVSRVSELEASLKTSTGKGAEEFGIGTFNLHRAEEFNTIRGNARIALAV
jgi:hypothetical protein